MPSDTDKCDCGHLWEDHNHDEDLYCYYPNCPCGKFRKADDQHRNW